MTDMMKKLEEWVADPNNQSVLFIRKMRSIAAKGSAGDGRVVATVNGYGKLTGMQIAPMTLALMQQDWKEIELDYVVSRWFLRGEASPEQAKEPWPSSSGPSKGGRRYQQGTHCHAWTF